jgi:large subunit ribosomal protein L44e
MKMPKKIRTYCPFCKTHQEHEVEKVKKGKASGMTRIARQKRRSFGIGNRGKFAKRPGSDKPTPRINLRYRCLNCHKAHLRPGFRARALELVEE